MCVCTSPLSAVPPCAEIAAVAVAMFALAWLNKKKNQNQKNQNQKNQKMTSGVFVSRRFTTLAKLSVEVSDVVSHKLSRNGLHRLIKL